MCVHNGMFQGHPGIQSLTCALHACNIPQRNPPPSSSSSACGDSTTQIHVHHRCCSTCPRLALSAGAPLCINLLPTTTAHARVIHVLRSAVLSKLACLSMVCVTTKRRRVVVDDDTTVTNFSRRTNRCSKARSSQTDKEDDERR
jgi:hypothetical protein